MKTSVVLAFSLWIVQSLPIALAHAADVAVCTPAQVQSVQEQPDFDEVKAHRRFVLPVISYPFGTKFDRPWGMDLVLRVDQTGRVMCYQLDEPFPIGTASLNASRRAVIARIKDWHYTPFLKNAKPTAVMVSEHVAEQELPDKPLPLPAAPLDQIVVALERTPCFGACPSYRVEIHGDGRVIYKGNAFVDVVGEHSYRIPPQEVARLVDSLRAKDIWSMRTDYTAQVTDNPNHMLTITVGNQTHKIHDYVGDWVGMPPAVSDFEDEIDEVAHTDMWLHLSMEGIDHLRAEHFNFRSHEGSELLKRASADGYRHPHDNRVVARLVELGARSGK